MRTILFLIIGTIVTLVLLTVCTVICAALIILSAKVISTQILTALPFSFIAGIALTFLFYGKIMRKIMHKCGLDMGNKQ